jgi:hypothetical protein
LGSIFVGSDFRATLFLSAAGSALNFLMGMADISFACEILR